MKPFMRSVLDEMPQDPYPIDPGEQATVVGYDDGGNLMVSWDNGSGLNLIPEVDRYHVVSTPEELEKSFEWLERLQESGANSKCPRCGKPFDVRRGALSRRVRISICDLCGQQEAVEDFLKGAKGTEVMPLTDWYIVKVWQGRFTDENLRGQQETLNKYLSLYMI